MDGGDPLVQTVLIATAASLAVALVSLVYYRRACSTSPRAYLYRSNGRRVIKHDLNGDVIRIGRHPNNEIHLQDRSVSRFHAQIVDNHNGNFVIRDLESRNGVRVYYRRVSSSVLSDGDVVFIGNVGLKFVQYPADYRTIPDTVELETSGPMRMSKRRRRAERFHAVRPVRVYADGVGWVSGNVRDISEEGMFIETRHPLPTRVPLDIVMQRNPDGRWFKLMAQVVRSEPNGVAVIFTDVDRTTKSVLYQVGKATASRLEPSEVQLT